ncbi:large ribosomal subunit protein uL16-like [Acropora palmata]|uniref:large ribosomal subunit protein uL16-like n=1 Tax=Acropora palmata TaxID=6131 RepID=UPI003DA125FB
MAAVIGLARGSKVYQPFAGWVKNSFTLLLGSQVPNILQCCHRATKTPLPVRYKYRDQLKYGIYAAQPALVKDCALESARLCIMRATKTRQLYMVKAQVAKTKKPLGSRMGKGKGKIDHYVANVKAGKILFEFECDSEPNALEAFKQVNHRLPIRLHLRIKPPEKKEIWTNF